MRFVLWDTHRRGVTKDFAGGYGVGQYTKARGLRGRIIALFFRRERRPVTLSYAYLAAILRQLGHELRYCVDRVPTDADVVIFHPSLVTLDLERRAMSVILAQTPQPRVLVVGPLARHLAQAFDARQVTLIDGDAEQLLWKLDDVLNAGPGGVELGDVADLDALPPPDWSPFKPERFRVAHDFWRFPTAFIELTRGCRLACDYCPYIASGRHLRSREPELVAEEMRCGIARHGFRSFKFRDPLFGANRQRVERLIDAIGRLCRGVQFSVESRIDLLPADLLVELKRVGLTSVTFGVETPDAATLRRHQRAPIADLRQRQFIETCRRLGIRTTAGFMLGFPDDTRADVRNVWRYARALNPTFANFNVVTPYPGTAFYDSVKDRIATFDLSRYDSYTPVIQGEHLSASEIESLLERAFVGYYFRWSYLREHGPLQWPRLAQLLGHRAPSLPAADLHASPRRAA